MENKEEEIKRGRCRDVILLNHCELYHNKFLPLSLCLDYQY